MHLSTSTMTIGALSMQTRCPVPTIRYCAPIGSPPRPLRAANGQRTYRDEDLKRLSLMSLMLLIKRCRDFAPVFSSTELNRP